MAVVFSFTANGESTFLEGIIPLEVNFEIMITSGSPVSYSWDFGDGVSDSTWNPSHVYTTYGSHKVWLKVTDSIGEVSSYSMEVVLGKLDFEVQPLIGDKPLSVHFDNKSVAPNGYNFEDWVWDFGDHAGVTGSGGEASPTHVYSEYGSYNVTLHAKMVN